MATKVAKDSASVRKRFRNLLKSLSRRHKPFPIHHSKSSTEHLVYVILAQRNPERRAAGAMRDIKAQFAGWNEVRVSSVLEIADVLRAHNVLNPLQKAEWIIRALGRTFSDQHKFKLDDLSRDDADETRVYMTRKLGLPPHVVADYLFSAFGYNRIPVDDSAGRLLQRLGYVDAKHEYPKLEKTLSEGLTSREAAEAYRLLEAFASETCLEKDPACARCPYFPVCPEGQARKAAAEAAKLAPPPPPVEEKKPEPPAKTAAHPPAGKPGAHPAKGASPAPKPSAPPAKAAAPVKAAKPGAAAMKTVAKKPSRPAGAKSARR